MKHIQIKELLEIISGALVDDPSQIQVKEIAGQQILMLELRAAKSDLGKIIGKQGQNAHAIRIIVNAAANKLRKRVVVEILE